MKPRKITGLVNCDGCDNLVTEAVVVGAIIFAYQARTATLCHDCLIEAVSLIAVGANIGVDVSHVGAIKPTPPAPTHFREGHDPQ